MSKDALSLANTLTSPVSLVSIWAPVFSTIPFTVEPPRPTTSLIDSWYRSVDPFDRFMLYCFGYNDLWQLAEFFYRPTSFVIHQFVWLLYFILIFVKPRPFWFPYVISIFVICITSLWPCCQSFDLPGCTMLYQYLWLIRPSLTVIVKAIWAT
mgnify:CR=1 FL=1